MTAKMWGSFLANSPCPERVRHQTVPSTNLHEGHLTSSFLLPLSFPSLLFLLLSPWSSVSDLSQQIHSFQHTLVLCFPAVPVGHEKKKGRRREEDKKQSHVPRAADHPRLLVSRLHRSDMRSARPHAGAVRRAALPGVRRQGRGLLPLQQVPGGRGGPGRRRLRHHGGQRRERLVPRGHVCRARGPWQGRHRPRPEGLQGRGCGDGRRSAREPLRHV